jgi:phosphopantetheinyl transferase
MPLYFECIADKYTKVGIWQIREDESFFLSRVPLTAPITHPAKRLQHLAGRYLLKYLFADFPYEELLIADTRKPYLQNQQYHFSISHCGTYAAAIVSSSNKVGIDIELSTEKIMRVRHKFVHVSEEKFLAESMVGSDKIAYPEILLWNIKEAIFKWYGLGEVDFKNHIRLASSFQFDSNRRKFFVQARFLKHRPIDLALQGILFESISCCWLMTSARY